MKEHQHERRSEPRHEAEWPVFLRSGKNTTQIGDVADISLSGVRIILNESVEIDNAEAKYDLYLCSAESPNDLMNISGRAVWHTERDHSLAIGLKLEHLDRRTKEMLKDYIDHRDALILQMDIEM